MKRRDFLKTTSGVAAGLALSGPTPLWAATVPKRPNLLFVTVDDMNWSMPGFMGNTLGLTPNLDKLAARSHRFVHCRTTAPICQPSREAMMTGRLPQHSGALGFTPVNEGVPTMVTTLKAAGYYTMAIHKTEHMQPESCFPWDHPIPGKQRSPSGYAGAVAQGMAEARAKKQPFFINCNINDPHRPFYGSDAAALVDHNEQGEYADARVLTAKEVKVTPNLDPLPDVETEFAQYCNSVQRMDRSIGAVLDALAAAPEAENTIVFFSADHGMPFPFAKATVYDYGTRTPALLHYPGMGRPKQFAERTGNIDYMPTLLDILRLPHPAGIDGVSWAPMLHGQRYAGPHLRVTHVNGVVTQTQYPQRAIQDERYSLIFMAWPDGKLHLHIESMSGLTYPAMVEAARSDPAIAARVQQLVMGVPLAFYDLRKDPGQRTNLIDRHEHAARIAGMKRSLHEYMVANNDPQLGNYNNFLAGKPMVVTQPERRGQGRRRRPPSDQA